jgi:hypothetical protein
MARWITGHDRVPPTGSAARISAAQPPAGTPSGNLDPPIYTQHSRSGALVVDGGMAVVPAW